MSELGSRDCARSGCSISHREAGPPMATFSAGMGTAGSLCFASSTREPTQQASRDGQGSGTPIAPVRGHHEEMVALWESPQAGGMVSDFAQPSSVSVYQPVKRDNDRRDGRTRDCRNSYKMLQNLSHKKAGGLGTDQCLWVM